MKKVMTLLIALALLAAFALPAMARGPYTWQELYWQAYWDHAGSWAWSEDQRVWFGLQDLNGSGTLDLIVLRSGWEYDLQTSDKQVLMIATMVDGEVRIFDNMHGWMFTTYATSRGGEMRHFRQRVGAHIETIEVFLCWETFTMSEHFLYHVDWVNNQRSVWGSNNDRHEVGWWRFELFRSYVYRDMGQFPSDRASAGAAPETYEEAREQFFEMMQIMAGYGGGIDSHIGWGDFYPATAPLARATAAWAIAHSPWFLLLLGVVVAAVFVGLLLWRRTK